MLMKEISTWFKPQYTREEGEETNRNSNFTSNNSISSNSNNIIIITSTK